MVERDGRARFLEGGNGVLLGTGTAPDRVDASAELTPGSTVLFYTDGLIERPGTPWTRGWPGSPGRGRLARRPLGSLCDALLTQVRPEDNDDDVAMLVLRVPDRGERGQDASGYSSPKTAPAAISQVGVGR